MYTYSIFAMFNVENLYHRATYDGPTVHSWGFTPDHECNNNIYILDDALNTVT